MNRSSLEDFQTGLFGLAEVLSLTGMYNPTFLSEASPVTSMAPQYSSEEKNYILEIIKNICPNKKATLEN